MVMTHEERRARRAEIADAVKAGESYESIADRLSVGISVVWSACREHGVKRKRSPRIDSLGSRTYQVLAAMLRGEKDADIAHEQNVSRQRIGQIREQAEAAGLEIGRSLVEAKRRLKHLETKAENAERVLKARRASGAVSEIERERAEYAIKHGTKEAANHYEVTINVIYKSLASVGKSAEHEKKRNSLSKSFKALKMLQAGNTHQSVADDLGMSIRWVSVVKEKALAEGVL